MRRLAAVPTFKPAYLIHGDDVGRVAERRARLRAVAEQEGGASGAEGFEGGEATPGGGGGGGGGGVLGGEEATRGGVAAALGAMTFAGGRRFIIVAGVERWRDKDGEKFLAALLGDVPPDTTVAFFAREGGRAKAPAA